MKKLFGKSFLALVLAMTMLMGMSMNVMAGPATPPGMPGTYVCDEHPGRSHYYPFRDPGAENPGKYDVYVYNANGQYAEVNALDKENFSAMNKWYYFDLVSHSYTECTSHNKTTPVASSHTHSYEWSVLSDPTTETDGVEAYICSCGDIQATQPISAAHNILKLNADAVKNAKADATVVVDLGRLNSLPKWFVTKLVERDDLNVTLKITYNHQNYTLEIPKTATIEDESIEWYGPLKLLSMFPQK